MSHPSWLKNFLKAEDSAKIEAAVQKAEALTTGEIVPVIVRRSSVTNQVKLILFLILFSFAVVLEDVFQLHEIVQPTAIVVGLLLLWPLSYWLARYECVQRCLTNPQDSHAQVITRAELEFYNCHVHKTSDQAAILIFVSLFEHQAVVLADKAIAKKLPPETWDNVTAELLAHIKKGEAGEGFIKAIQMSGEILVKHFPRVVGDQNELHNRLVIKE